MSAPTDSLEILQTRCVQCFLVTLPMNVVQTFVVLVFKPRSSVKGSLQHRPMSSAVFDRSAALFRQSTLALTTSCTHELFALFQFALPQAGDGKVQA